MTKIGEVLQANQISNLSSRGYNTKLDIREASDEELMRVSEIGPASLEKLREWAKLPPKKGKEAVAKRFLLIKNEKGEQLSVRPGDLIPEDFNPEEYVNKRQATWR